MIFNRKRFTVLLDTVGRANFVKLSAITLIEQQAVTLELPPEMSAEQAAQIRMPVRVHVGNTCISCALTLGEIEALAKEMT